MWASVSSFRNKLHIRSSMDWVRNNDRYVSSLFPLSAFRMLNWEILTSERMGDCEHGRGKGEPWTLDFEIWHFPICFSRKMFFSSFRVGKIKFK